jgi:ribosomal protein L7/L12
MTSDDVYERLGVLEQLVRHLYEKTGVQVPDLQTLAQRQLSVHVRRLLAAGNKIGAIKAYRDEANVDLATATGTIESLLITDEIRVVLFTHGRPLPGMLNRWRTRT